jgi:hypothetical protein
MPAVQHSFALRGSFFFKSETADSHSQIVLLDTPSRHVQALHSAGVVVHGDIALCNISIRGR